ncbi:SAVMC3_10250 family protein [Streptomyces sp. GLT-R25]
MRELVYLSDGKLQRFVPKLRALWRRPDVTLSSPFGSVAFTGSPNYASSRLRNLRRIEKEIERSAGWFTESPIRAGRWVAFEAPLNYFTLAAPLSGTVLFVDTPKATAEYPTGGRVRLVLHGSSRHLLNSRTPRQIDPPVRGGY